MSGRDCAADFKAINADKRAYVAVFHAFHTLAAHALEGVGALSLSAARGHGARGGNELFPGFRDGAAVNAAKGNAATVFACEIQRGYQHLRGSRDSRRAGNGVDDGCRAAV